MMSTLGAGVFGTPMVGRSRAPRPIRQVGETGLSQAIPGEIPNCRVRVTKPCTSLWTFGANRGRVIAASAVTYKDEQVERVGGVRYTIRGGILWDTKRAG